jgi:threonine/homoserine/homoserine lactone efflux protein
MNTLITLLKKNLGIITVALMLGWGIGNAFWMPLIAAGGFFCAVIVPTVNAAMGKKYAIRFAVVGVVWMVIALIIGSQYGWSEDLSDFLT